MSEQSFPEIFTPAAEVDRFRHIPELLNSCNVSYFYLLLQGSDIFQAQVNIEVQHADELTIATVERHRGMISLGYYDPLSLEAICYPLIYFNRGKPIQKRALPPKDLVPYYTNPEQRGYLADPEEVQKARESLAQKFGYTLSGEDFNKDMFHMRKDPRQIFFGLEPGWIVNLRDRTILKPTNEEVKEYYRN